MNASLEELVHAVAFQTLERFRTHADVEVEFARLREQIRVLTEENATLKAASPKVAKKKGK